MAVYQPDQYRNVAIVGHNGSGKTTLAEALLFKTGMTTRLGSVPDHTSILDFTEESREKLSSLDSAVCHLTHKGLHVNLVDTPGTQAFCGMAIASFAAVECAVLAVSATAGVQVNTRSLMERARSYGLGTWIVVTHIDAPNVELAELLAEIRESFGTQCVPLNLPTNKGKGVIDCFANETGNADFGSVAEAHTGILEAAVSADDKLMEKYLSGELSVNEARAVAAKAVAEGVFTPVFFVNSKGDVGIAEFLDALPTFCPSPVTGKRRKMMVDGAETEITPG
ncbi:MAG: GTP-binding protein, partial [Thermoplasmata archaeon]